MARRRERPTDLHGVLVVDKPAGMTSHDVVDVVRRAAGMRRVGHTGTLDPDATGVLVVCLGRATRLVQHLQTGAKTYAARMVLGRETTTQDAGGEVVREVDASHVTEAELCEALTTLVGGYEQVPPMVSAVKVDGERLHAIARRGETAEVEPRFVRIDQLVMEAFEPGRQPEASFLVTCGPGTYVRTIAHDIGAALGVGASLLSLRRWANGGVTVEDAVTLDEVRERGAAGTLPEVVRPPAAALADRPSLPVHARRGHSSRPRWQLPSELLPGGEDDLVVLLDRDAPGERPAGDMVGLYGPDGRARVVLLRPDELTAEVTT